MNMIPIGEMDFDGVILDASFIGRKYIGGVMYDCFQPSFDECVLVRCEPINRTDILFIDVGDF
ncbi:MAG: hypothetical protein KAS32_04825 [Candidatus Peribacteraceae bacterium]|nr:hypothetical protein [Candidatus Peribacteraceae bacterium]